MIFFPGNFIERGNLNYKYWMEIRIDALIATINSLAFILSGIGLLLFKKWGRFLIMLLVLILIFNGIYEFFTEIPQYSSHFNAKRQFEQLYAFFCCSLQIIFSLATLYFFTRPKVKEQFK